MRSALNRMVTGYGGAGWGVVDQSFVSASNFLSIYLLARAMAPEDFGVFMLAYTGLLFMTSLQYAFITQPHNYLAAPLADREYAQFTGMLTLMQVFLSVFLCLLVALAGTVIWTFYSVQAGAVLTALSLAAFPWLAQEFVRRTFYTKSRSKSAAFNDFLCYGLQLAGIVWITLVARDATPVSALLIYGASSLAAVFLGGWQLRQVIHFEGVGPLRERFLGIWRQVWEFGKWLLGQSLVNWFGANGHGWVVFAILGAEAVGLYRAAAHLVNVINPVCQVAAAYFPARASRAFHKGGPSQLAQWVRASGMYLLLPLVPIALVLILFPEEILRLAYGHKYAGMGLGAIVAIAAVSQVTNVVNLPMQNALLAMSASKLLFIISLIPVLLLLTTGVAFITFFGILGVALSGLVIASVSIVATYWVYRRQMQQGRGSLASA